MDDSYPSDRDEAVKLIETCSECAALAADVRSIATAMQRLPVAARTRDFTITAEQAERLHGSRLSRWLRTLAMPSWGVLRPVAGVALSIGLVMAVVGAGIPGMQPAAETFTNRTTDSGDSGALPPSVPRAAATPLPGDVSPVLAPASPAAPEGQFEAAQETEDPASRNLDSAYVLASPEPDTDGERAELTQSVPTDPTRDVLVFSGLLIATLSLALLTLAWAARRYFADPLLR